MHKIVLAFAAAGLIGLGAGPAGAAAQLSQQDQTFMKKAAQGNLAEIQGGQLAAQHGTSSATKQLGQTLATDHTQMNDQLMQLAQQRGVTLPKKTDSADARQMRSVEKLSGKKFDQAFAKDEVADHQKTIKMFQQEAQNTKDPALHQWIESGIPVLQKHLQMAEQAETAG